MKLSFRLETLGLARIYTCGRETAMFELGQATEGMTDQQERVDGAQAFADGPAVLD